MIIYQLYQLQIILILDQLKQPSSIIIDLQRQRQRRNSMIKGPNIKIFKFPRKEIQISEEINNKKINKDDFIERKQEKSSTHSLALLKKDQNNLDLDLDFEKRGQISEKQGIINSTILQKNDKQFNKNIHYVKLNQKGVSFDKKLAKLTIPDSYQKLRPVHKIQNKLLGCLQKKKALIPMKKLVKPDLLNDILNKKQRKLLTKRARFTDQLELEAQSLRKKQNSFNKSPEKHSENIIKKHIFQQTNKVNIKLAPIQYFKGQKQEEIVQKLSSNSQFIFQPTQVNAFSFLNNQDSLFQSIEESFPSQSIFAEKNMPKEMGFFSSQIKKKTLFHDYQTERQRQQGIFSNNKSLFFQNPFQDKYKQKKKELNIANIRVPRFQDKYLAAQDDRIDKKFNIFSIQQENSLYFSPQKLQNLEKNSNVRQLNNQIQRDCARRTLKSQSSSQYSSYY